MNITRTAISPSSRFSQKAEAFKQPADSAPLCCSTGENSDSYSGVSPLELSLTLAESAGRTDAKADSLFKESETLAKARKREVRWGAACLLGAAGLALYSATQGEWGETIGSLTDGRAAALGSLMLGTGGTSLLIENRFQNSEISLGKSVQAREEAQLLRESSLTMAAWGNILR